MPEGSKWCPDCGTIKPHSEFPRTKANRSGIHTYCKPCHNARGRATVEKVGGSRTYHLKRRYGITAEDFDAMFAEQGGVCAICASAPAEHVDHCHDTGRVRQLLCFNCNGGLGQFKDAPSVLRAAAEYVERHRVQLSIRPSRPPEPLRGDRPCNPTRRSIRRRVAGGRTHDQVVRERLAFLTAQRRQAAGG